MGICSSLFYSSDPDKPTLYGRLLPTDDQYEEQQDRWNSLADYLVEDLKKRTGRPIRTWLQGSYKYGTQIRPARLNGEFDIDLGVYFSMDGEREDGLIPEELKALVQRSLAAYRGDGVKSLVSPPKERCSRIAYEGKFHIDIPVYHLNSKSDTRMLATETKGWERSDPKKLYLWFRNKFEKAPAEKCRRHVRCMKCWAGLSYLEHDKGRPSSTLLTVLVAEAIPGIPAGIMASDDDALLAILSKIVRRLSDKRKVRNPVDGTEDLTGRFSERGFAIFLEKLKTLEGIAQNALDCESAMEGADEWSKAFEHFFPLPEEIKKASSLFENLPAITTVPEIHVSAVSRKDGRKWSGVNRIGPIPKGCDIDFEIQNARSFPSGSEVHWMVRNGGAEAEYVNDLGHRASSSGFTNRESSSYKGTHFMDCTVRRFGQIIGFQRVPVTIEGDFQTRKINKKPFYNWKGRR